MKYTGNDILALGIAPGPHIKLMLERANTTGVCTYDALRDLLPAPMIPLRESPDHFSVNIHADTPEEQSNLDAVIETMNEVMRTPVVLGGAIMPDACPAGPVGTIPVGGVVVSRHVHPGMHSADICCSVMVSLHDTTPEKLMANMSESVWFGPGGRKQHVMSDNLRDRVRNNGITRAFEDVADWHMGTQGDGNHFVYVGVQRSTGKTALVTHFGSRGFGARVYKAGMAVAERYRRAISPETLKQNAWIPYDAPEFGEYMRALDVVQDWTQENHRVLHGHGEIVTWTIHNFVFERDGLLYHGKGATPAWSEGKVEAIPLNMAEPVLLVRGCNNDESLGFMPHGAGRNMSRSAHLRSTQPDIAAETAGLDVRFWSGEPDLSELPSAYKNAASVRRDIEAYGLGVVVDEITPYGCIMAGHIQKNW